MSDRAPPTRHDRGRPHLFVANRGEIAVRIVRTATDLGLSTCVGHPADHVGGLALRLADASALLPGSGPAAYLDADAVVAVAVDAGCTHLHPGYGFLSESPALAAACAATGITFVGPSAEVLAVLADKSRARALAVDEGVPVLEATAGSTSLAEAEAFLASLGPEGAVMVKAIAGGGGRGLRPVVDPQGLAEAYARARAEAEAASGVADVFVERLVRRARHIEVQVVGDGRDATHLFDRECTIQRRRQKLVEVAPAPDLAPEVRAAAFAAAVRLVRSVGLRGVATVEFLVDADQPDRAATFMEVNPRLQVEHTVTEEVCGIDLVAIQLALADGAALTDLALPSRDRLPRGFAVQARVAAEIVGADGTIQPATGRLESVTIPSGPGVRVDTDACPGLRPDPRFDTLLAKVVVRSAAGDVSSAFARARRRLGELATEGVATNAGLLRAVLAHPEVVAGRATTGFVDDHLAELLAAADRDRPNETGGTGCSPTLVASADPTVAGDALSVVAPTAGVVVAIEAASGDVIGPTTTIVVLESMKMHHPVGAGIAGVVREVFAAVGDAVAAGDVLAAVEPGEGTDADAGGGTEIDPASARADVDALAVRRALLADASRPEAVERRTRTGHRTARASIAHLCDEGSFEEWGGLAFAAQTKRRGTEELMRATPADGLVTGIGRVNGDMFTDDRARCAVLSYDYTVLAGTQGYRNHQKKDRLFELAERLRLPVVLFAEGGGGRPGDTDVPVIAGLDTRAFALYARLSGLVPLVGIAAGRCFAGNAALLGCSDVVIATADATIGMGGPAMIEGGGLGVYRPEDVGPVSVQAPNGVIDILVDDDAAAVDAAKAYLSYFQGPITTWDEDDQRRLRHVVPEDRLRVYDVRRAVHTLADTGSVLELRRAFGVGIVTALARIEGRPVGLVANDPTHLGGAIDTPAADKAARFLQLCDAFDLPVVFLCDTPGFMVGPDAERTAQVRHVSRLFVVGASLTVPIITIVLRKGYGLGAQAMAGGSFREPDLIVSWPTGEFGGMGLEGAVRLAYRRELDVIADSDERRAAFDNMVAAAYERGQAVNMAAHLEIDDVIDPADTRSRITGVLRAHPPVPVRTTRKRPCVDPW